MKITNVLAIALLAVMELMKERGTYYVPTILAGEWVAEKAKIEDFFPELVRPKAAAIGPVINDTFRRAYRAGVPIVFGTDSGVSPHGDNAREFALMVEAGMPPHGSDPVGEPAMRAAATAPDPAGDRLAPDP